MYHAMYAPQMLVQIMGGQQMNSQCLSMQTYSTHINGTNQLHQSEYAQYVRNASGHTRHQTIQTGSYPLELLQLMGTDIASIRHADYIQTRSSSPSVNWQRRITSSCSTPTIPPTRLNFRPTNTNSTKKPAWNNKTIKRNSYQDSVMQNDKYSSDSGFSSRSPTPNKHQIDSSQTESSDERDSVISTERGMKKLHKARSDYNIPNNKLTETGLIQSVSAHQFYQNQQPVDYCYTSVPTPRSQVPSYQNKRRYHSGRNSPPLPRNQRGRRYSGVFVPSYSMFPRYYIAPDRFLARAHLIEMNRAPDDLVIGSSWDDLSHEIWAKFMSNQQTEIVYRNKMMLWKCLYIHIKTAFPKYGLFLVGSTMNGFGSDNSDVDMCLLVRHTEMDQRNEAIVHLEQILKWLKRCNFIEHLELIQAKVPILKFRDSVYKLEVDLNCNNAVGIRNTHLLYCYSQIDWRVRPLVLVVKLWAQCQNINDAKHMTISSYSLVLMVIHFLQCGISPPVLPCLHSLYPGKFGPHTEIHTIDIHEDLDIPASVLHPTNRQSLGELFVEFFRYYVTFDQYAISVRLANKIPIEECRRARSYKNDPHQWKYLCIEEPFDLTNTARSVYDPEVFAKIKGIFDRTYQKLKESHDLSDVFVKMDPVPSRVST